MTQLQATTPTTTISAETHLQGTLTFEGNTVVHGRVNGTISGSGQVSIGQASVCQATIEATTVIVDGTVEGNILAKESVQLTSSARVTGDIFAQSITIATGAVFQGKVRITSAMSTSEIETKSAPAEMVRTPEPDRQTPVAASTWTPAKPASQPTSLGAGLSSLGASRASWPNQR